MLPEITPATVFFTNTQHAGRGAPRMLSKAKIHPIGKENLIFSKHYPKAGAVLCCFGCTNSPML